MKNCKPTGKYVMDLAFFFSISIIMLGRSESSEHRDAVLSTLALIPYIAHSVHCVGTAPKPANQITNQPLSKFKVSDRRQVLKKRKRKEKKSVHSLTLRSKNNENEKQQQCLTSENSTEVIIFIKILNYAQAFSFLQRLVSKPH